MSIHALAPLYPELSLVAGCLALLLAARRIQSAFPAAAVTVAAAAAAMGFAWPSPLPADGFSGAIAPDGYAAFFKLLFAATLAAVALLSTRMAASERVRPAEHYALLLLAATGMMITASAADLLTLYLGLELMALSSYVLVGITRDRPAAIEAALKYFLLGSCAAAVFLYGTSLIYGLTKTTELAAVAAAIAADAPVRDPLLAAAIALVLAGLAFKIAAVPFHAWAPDAYEGASAPVAAFLAVGSKAAGFAALGRVCLGAFASEPIWSVLLAPLAALSMVVGSLLALSQTNIKRMLAYSSIAHAGYALLGLLPGTPQALSATLAYLAAYAFMTLGAFAVVVGLGERGEELAGYEGLAAKRGGLAALMLLLLLSLTGIPPTAGFSAKFLVFTGALRAGYWGLALLGVACSVVSAFFYLRVAVLMYMTPPKGEAPEPISLPVATTLGIAAAGTLLMGLFPSALTYLTLVAGVAP